MIIMCSTHTSAFTVYQNALREQLNMDPYAGKKHDKSNLRYCRSQDFMTIRPQQSATDSVAGLDDRHVQY